MRQNYHGQWMKHQQNTSGQGLTNNLPDIVKDPLDLRHNMEAAMITPGDDGTCTLQQILQSPVFM